MSPHTGAELPRGIRQQIVALVQESGPGLHEAQTVDLIENALKLHREVEDRADVRTIQTALRELRYAYRLFEGYRGIRKVSVFGSARTDPKTAEYRLASEFGQRIAEAGFMVITGAGGGIMQAANEGAGRNMSFGANIQLPFEQQANPIVADDPKLINFRYFFTRKLNFIRQSDAIVLFPGGFGTMDECFETLTLMQTGKSRIRPLILLEPAGGTFWRAWDDYIQEHLLNKGLISRDDLQLYHLMENPERAVQSIQRFYRNYHSSRFVGDQCVIRLRHLPSPTAIDALNEDYADLIEGARFHVTEPTTEEQADNDALEHPRLSFGFDRRSYGRFRQLIDTLNSF